MNSGTDSSMLLVITERYFFTPSLKKNRPLITNTTQKKSKLDTQIVYWFATKKITGQRDLMGSVLRKKIFSANMIWAPNFDFNWNS